MGERIQRAPLSDQDIAEDFGIEIFEYLNDNVARDYIAELQHLRQEKWFSKSVNNQRPDLWRSMARSMAQNRAKCLHSGLQSGFVDPRA
jgi:hypothetical protein